MGGNNLELLKVIYGKRLKINTIRARRIQNLYNLSLQSCPVMDFNRF